MTATTSPTPHRDPAPLLEVTDLVQRFRVKGGVVHAVDGVSFRVDRGETLALVGESGCGKSSLARALMRLPRPSSGSVRFQGNELTTLSTRRMHEMLRHMQMIFQDPIASLNPRRRARDIVAEGLTIHGVPRAESAGRAASMMSEVGLDAATMGGRRPGDFSGGQCQRIAIARAMALEPELLICDEPVSALDVSVQAQVLNLLEKMRTDHDLGVLFISHDLSVVRNISDRVAVMYLGKIVELCDTDRLYAQPAHPYSRALLESLPVPDPDAVQPSGGLTGELPSPLSPPSGCRFRTRCALAQPRCASEEPALRRIADGRDVACHFPLVEESASAPASAEVLG